MSSARCCGLVSLTLMLTAYLYYTVWILVMPLVDETHAMQSYFPDRMWSIYTTTLLAYCQIAFMFTFVGIVLIKD